MMIPSLKKISFFAFLSLLCFSEICVAQNAITEEEDVDTLWDSKPEEIQSASIQVLDKISGKVFRKNVKVNEEMHFESLVITLKRCFKNSADDPNEVYAYVTVQDGERVRFSGWIFASAPAINLFEHSIYDVRVEF